MSQTIAISPVQRGFIIAGEAFTTTGGISKTAKFAAAVIAFLGKVLGSLAEGWHTLRGACKSCVEFLDVMEIFIRITEWVKGDVKGAWKIASRICLTVFNALSFVSFLEKIKLIDLNPVMEKLSSIPVIGWIVNLPLNLIGLVSFTFSIVHNSLALRKSDAKLRELKSPQADEKESTFSKSHPKKMTHIDFKISQANVERSKILLALITDVVKIALILLCLIGPFVGGILSTTSIPMMTFSVAVAGLGLYKFFHDKFAEEYIDNSKKVIAKMSESALDPEPKSPVAAPAEPVNFTSPSDDVDV